MTFLNFDLLRRPLNWLIVWSMVILAAFALHYSLALIHGQPVLGKHPSRNT